MGSGFASFEFGNGVSPVGNPGLQEQAVGGKDAATVESMVATGEGWELKSGSPEAVVISLLISLLMVIALGMHRKH